ncbi:MAG: hypothetical protein IJ165_14405, partial [Proteobacteria bacterium]|nr:hypothetical protein [Pseudomonadota bacterium]
MDNPLSNKFWDYPDICDKHKNVFPLQTTPTHQTKPNQTKIPPQILPFFGKGVWGKTLSFGTKERVSPTQTAPPTPDMEDIRGKSRFEIQQQTHVSRSYF